MLIGFADPTGLIRVPDIVLDYIAAIENQQAAERRLQEATLSNILETFAFVPVVVTDGSTGTIQSFHYTQSPHTYILLDAMNAEFYAQNIPPVSMETLLEHMPVIYALYHDRLDSDVKASIQETIRVDIQNKQGE